MKYICDGHEYTYNRATSSLSNNYGRTVARLTRSPCGEYLSVIDPETGDEIHRQHENSVPVTDGYFTVQAYVAFAA